MATASKIQRISLTKFVVRLKGGAQGASPSPAPGAGGDAPPMTTRERLLKEADDFAYFGALGLPGSMMMSPLREASVDAFALPEAAAPPETQPQAATRPQQPAQAPSNQQQRQQPQTGSSRKRGSQEAPAPSDSARSGDTGADSEGPLNSKRRKTAAAAKAKPPAPKAAAKKAAAGADGGSAKVRKQQQAAPKPVAAASAVAQQQQQNHKQQRGGTSNKAASSSEHVAARPELQPLLQQPRSQGKDPSPAAAPAAALASAPRVTSSPEQEAASAPSAGPSWAGEPSALALPGLFADICPPGAPPAAAAALSGLPLAPITGSGSCAGPGSRPPAPTREALDYMFVSARRLKHQGDGRFAQSGRVWDVYGLTHYALAVVGYLEYADAIVRAHAAGGQSLGTGLGEPHDASAQRVSSLLADTAKLAAVGATSCAGVRGPELAKQALVMLLERLQAIAHMRSLAAQQDRISVAAARMRAGGSSGSGGGYGTSASPAASAAQLQCRPPAPLVAPAPGGGSGAARGPSGKAAGGSGPSSKASDDSNASCQTLPGAGGGATGAAVAGIGPGSSSGAGGAAPPSAAAAAAAAARAADEQRLLLRSVGTMLRLTEVMHSAVLRLQQFMECPEVQASVPARQAGVHMAALGMDAGAYSVSHLAAHAKSTVTCIVQLLRSAQR